MANYLVIFFMQLGIPDPYKILVISASISLSAIRRVVLINKFNLAVGAILIVLTAAGFFVQGKLPQRLSLPSSGALSNSYYAPMICTDFFGRRTLLISGGAAMAGSLLAVGAITTANPTPTGALANVTIFLSEHGSRRPAAFAGFPLILSRLQSSSGSSLSLKAGPTSLGRSLQSYLRKQLVKRPSRSAHSGATLLECWSAC